MLLTALAAKPAKGPIEFEPDPERAPEGTELLGGSWLREIPGLTLLLKQLRNEERQAYLAQNIGLSADPFASRPDQPARYLTFQFVMENHSDGELAFNPRSAWLVPGDNKVRSPVGLT